MLDRKKIDRFEFTEDELKEIEKIYDNTILGFLYSTSDLYESFYKRDMKIHTKEFEDYRTRVTVAKIFLYGYVKGIR